MCHMDSSSPIMFRRMYWVFLGLLGSAIAAQSSYDLETRAVSFPGKPSSLGPLYSSGLSSAQGFRDNSYEDNAVTPTPSPTPIYRNQQPLYRKPTATPIDARDYSQSTAIRIGSPSRAPARGQYGPNGPTQEELEEEKEEPDRLSLLLPQSRFDCVNKQTGYYADEDLNCEVFHYCQDNAKHSWICPEGFTFHQ
ncbi:putative proteinv, partial [Lasius niger]